MTQASKTLARNVLHHLRAFLYLLSGHYGLDLGFPRAASRAKRSARSLAVRWRVASCLAR
jgi:hypothetical protein